MTDRDVDSASGYPSTGAPEQDHRGRRIWWMIVAVGFVVFIGFIMLGRPLVEGRLTAARNLDRATAMIPGTDDAFASIDSAVRALSSRGTMDSSSATEAAIAEARAVLVEAVTLSQSGYEKLTEDEQRRATIVKAMATARLKALDAAEAVVLPSGESGGASTAREQAVKDYEAAIEAVRQADAALGKL